MPMDSLFDYLRRCKGQDFLTFDNSEAASKARDLLIQQLEEDDVPIEARPSIDQFDNQLRLRLKETSRAAQPTAQVEKVR
jgi:hypothetical protein